MKYVYVRVFVVLIFVVLVLAEELQQKDYDAEVTGRRRRFRHRMLWWFAGIQALGIFFAVKLKLILITFAVGWLLFHGIKIWIGTKLLGSTCPEPIPILHSESSAYSNSIPFDHGIEFSPNLHTNPEIYSSYPGPEQYSGSHYETSGYGGPVHSSGYVDTLPLDTSDVPTPSVEGPYHRRVAKQKRDLSDEDYEMDFGDIAFMFLGVRLKACKMRFLCEMKFRTSTSKFSKMAFELLSETIFVKYRDDSPKQIGDCIKLYSECRMPADSNTNKLNQSTENSDLSDNHLGRFILKRSKKKLV